MIEKNFSLLTDLYELTMMQGFLKEQIYNKKAVFDIFYRDNPHKNGYAIFAGLEQVLQYIKNLKFGDDDINYLRSLNLFEENFLNYLREFNFTGTIYSVKEGSVIFPKEPIMKIIAPLAQAHLIEGAILNIINYQSLIATKASRMVAAAEGDQVMELGLRRAQGESAAVYGARAAVIGGFSFTSNVMAGRMFGLNVAGTHSHSWVMSFKNELQAFRAYAKVYPSKCILLVDTYNTLKSGVPNAIKIFNELNINNHKGVYGIRLDSGDLAYLSKEARKMLDEAGHTKAIIAASNDLNEYLIKDLKQQGAKITMWGVGTNLITSEDQPSFGGVYKLSAIEDENGDFIPKIKISETQGKINNPGNKKVFRIYDKATNKVRADLISLVHETIDTTKDLTIFHPVQTWKKMKFKADEFYVKETLQRVIDNGYVIYKSPNIKEIQQYAKEEKETLWEEFSRLTLPNILPVDLSSELHNLKLRMIDDALA